MTIFGGRSANTESKLIDGEDVENIMPVQDAAPADMAPATDSTTN